MMLIPLTKLYIQTMAAYDTRLTATTEIIDLRIRQRFLKTAQKQNGNLLCLSVRTSRRGEGILFSVVDQPEVNSDRRLAGESEPKAVRATVAALGGEICTVEDPNFGRVSSICLERLAVA
jgi:hypothetical protein